jgi:hypothetical protein
MSDGDNARLIGPNNTAAASLKAALRRSLDNLDCSTPPNKGERRAPHRSPLVTITSTVLDVFVIDAQGQPRRPWLTLAWRSATATPCGVHVDLLDDGNDHARACVADNLGIARRALELDSRAIDDILLRGEPVTFSLDTGSDTVAFKNWALAHGFDVARRNPGPYFQTRAEREVRRLSLGL